MKNDKSPAEDALLLKKHFEKPLRGRSLLYKLSLSTERSLIFLYIDIE